MTCDFATSAIWARLREDDPMPTDLGAHLETCLRCQREWLARIRLARTLGRHRRSLEDEPPPSLDDRLSRELADLTVLPAANSPGPVRPAPSGGGLSRWVPQPSAGWLAALCLLIWTTSALGFLAGRSTRPAASEVHPPAPWLQRLPTHKVQLSPRGVQALGQGNTYLLVGPAEGPYQVVAVTHWEAADLDTVVGSAQSVELVLAVGPAGGWSRGKELAVADLTDRGGEILARRALPVRH